MKTCTKCREAKPVEDFDLDKRIRSGRIAKCKTCTRAQRRAYYKANPTEKRARDRLAAEKWRRNNPERARQKATEASRKFREANPDYYRQWYQDHIDRERERSRASMREARLRDPDAERQRKRRYRANNRQAVAKTERENVYARRARQPFSRELANHMAELIQQPCTYCGETENITIDHVVPLSRGGKHEASNLAPACFSCNSSKNNLLLSEWNGRAVLAGTSDHSGSPRISED